MINYIITFLVEVGWIDKGVKVIKNIKNIVRFGDVFSIMEK